MYPTFNVINFEFSAKLVDVETAILYRDLEEELDMECSQGMFDIGSDDCVILNKWSMVLLNLQGSTKKAVEILKKTRFVGGNVNPCLYAEKSEKGYSLCRW